MQLWQDAGALTRTTLLSEVFLPLPGVGQGVTQSAPTAVEFSSLAHARVASHTQQTAGQGRDGGEQLEYLTGALTVVTGWAADPVDGSVLCPPLPAASQEAQLRTVRRLHALATLGRAGLADAQHQQQWLVEAGVDPNDPDNAPLLATLAGVGPGTLGGAHGGVATAATLRAMRTGTGAAAAAAPGSSLWPATQLGLGTANATVNADTHSGTLAALLGQTSSQPPPFRLYDALTGPIAAGTNGATINNTVDGMHSGLPGDAAGAGRASEGMGLSMAVPLVSGLTPRQCLMRLRHEQEPLVRTARVPLMEDEVPLSLLERAARHRRGLSGAAADAAGDDPLEIDEPDPVLRRLLRRRRSGVGAFLHGVREEQAQRLKSLASQRRLSEVVNEEALPNIKGLGQVLARTVEPRRPLRPSRNPRRKAAPFVAARVRVVARVGQAMNVPLRSTDADVAGSGSGVGEGGLERELNSLMATLVAPVVEVELQGQRVSTAAARGTSVVYNEEFVLNFRPPNGDASPESIRHCQDEIYFHILDDMEVGVWDVVVEAAGGKRERERERQGERKREGHMEHYTAWEDMPRTRKRKRQTYINATEGIEPHLEN